MGIEAGDKMVIFGHERGKRLVVVKAEVVTEHVTRALGDLAALEAQLRRELAPEKLEEKKTPLRLHKKPRVLLKIRRDCFAAYRPSTHGGSVGGCDRTRAVPLQRPARWPRRQPDGDMMERVVFGTIEDVNPLLGYVQVGVPMRGSRIVIVGEETAVTHMAEAPRSELKREMRSPSSACRRSSWPRRCRWGRSCRSWTSCGRCRPSRLLRRRLRQRRRRTARGGDPSGCTCAAPGAAESAAGRSPRASG